MPSTPDLIARLRDLLAESASDFYDDATELIPALNDGKEHMHSEVDAISVLLSVTVEPNVSDIVPETRIKRVVSLYANGQPLSLVLAGEVPAKGFAATGIPTHYCTEYLNGDGVPVIRLFPTPTAATPVVASFYGVTPDLALADAENNVEAVDPTWHREFHYVPCYYAAAQLLIKDNRNESAELMRARYLDEVERYRRWLNKRLSSHTVHVKAQPLGDTFETR